MVILQRYISNTVRQYIQYNSGVKHWFLARQYSTLTAMPTISNKFTQQLNIKHAFVQAPMAGHSTVAMCAAVCNTGALGSIAGARITAETIIQQCTELRKLTDKPFAVNLFIPPTTPQQATEEQRTAVNNTLQKIMHDLNIKQSDLSTAPAVPDYNAQIQAILQIKPAVFSFTFGMPSADIVQQCKQNNILLQGTATTAAEATYLVEHGCDMILLQGSEAGGHRGSFLTSDTDTVQQATIGILSLITQCQSVVPAHIPLIAAGGIADPHTAYAAFVLGVDAVCVGTMFLTTPECNIIPQVHKDLLLAPSRARKQGKSDREIAAAYRHTCLTRVFSGKPARGIYNTIIEEFNPIANNVLPWNSQSAVLQPLQKYAGSVLKNGEYIQAWAGQSYVLCEEKSSADVVNDIMNELHVQYRTIHSAQCNTDKTLATKCQHRVHIP